MLFLQVFILATVLALACADGPPPHHAPHHAPHYEHAPPVYNYQYAVLDDYHGTNFGQTESRDGYNTQGKILKIGLRFTKYNSDFKFTGISGEYHVLLPDGRLQTVTYHVDGEYGGYIADVKYSGHAKLAPHPVKPAYHPAPHHA